MDRMEKTLLLSEIITKQATFNAGIVGHVSHGKSTLTYRLTGTRTQRHSSEKKTNDRTVKLGYANAKIYLNPETGLIKVTSSSADSFIDPVTGTSMKLVKHVSIPDCPGHDEFMATMLGGSTVMDMALLVVAANQSIPQVQTYEHLLALRQTDISKVLVIHNKLDLLTKEESAASLAELKTFLEGSPADGAPIIPMSAELGYNLEEVCKYLCYQVDNCEFIRDYHSPARMTVVRSFNVNKPSSSVFDLKGAVVGGSVYRGVLSVGDHIEMKPGIIRPGPTGKPVLQPLIGVVINIQSDERHDLEQAVPGGLIGVELTLDSGFSTADKLVGFQLGHVGTLSRSYDEISGKTRMLRNVDQIEQDPFKAGEKVKIVSSGSMFVTATVTAVGKKKLITLKTDLPIAIDMDTKLAVMRGNKLTAVLTAESGKLSYAEVYPDGYDEFKSSWVPPLYNVVDDLTDVVHAARHDLSPYNELLKNIVFKGEDLDKVLRIPPIEVNYPTKHHAEIPNILTIIAAIDLHTEEDKFAINVKDLVLAYFKAEMTDTTRYNKSKDGSDQLLMDGRKKVEDIQSIVKKLITRVFRCPACRSSCRTIISKLPGERLYERRCLDCPSVTHMKSLF